MISRLATKLTDKRKKELKTIEQRLTDFSGSEKKLRKGRLMQLIRHLKKQLSHLLLPERDLWELLLSLPDEQNKKKGENVME